MLHTIIYLQTSEGMEIYRRNDKLKSDSAPRRTPMFRCESAIHPMRTGSRDCKSAGAANCILASSLKNYDEKVLSFPFRRLASSKALMMKAVELNPSKTCCWSATRTTAVAS